MSVSGRHIKSRSWFLARGLQSKGIVEVKSKLDKATGFIMNAAIRLQNSRVRSAV